MDKALGFFESFFGGRIPGAFSIYLQARESYLLGDYVRAEKLKNLNYFFHNSEVPYTAKLGKNCIFAYGGIGVIIHPDSVLGERCNIGSGVTIGGNRAGVPSIGHDVFLSTGAKLIGAIKIGNGAIIGANSVVLSDVEPFTVVAGAPAKKVAEINNTTFDKYQGFYWCKNNQDKVNLFKKYYFKDD